MANEITTTIADDIRYTALIAERVLQEARPLSVSWPLFRSQGPGPGVGVQFPIQDDPGAASGLTQGTAMTNTAVTMSNATVTAGTVGQQFTVTDETQAASVPDAVAWFSGVLGRAVAEKIEVDHSANYANFATVVGSTGTDFTLIQFITAQSDLAINEAVGQIHCVLHPQQVLDLQAGSGNTPGGIMTALSAGSNYLANPDADLNIMDLQNLGGYVGSLYGIGIFQTTAVGTANNGADRAGAMFVSDALGRYEVWGPRVESQRNASLPGVVLAATARYGTGEIRDLWGVSIITDA